MPKVSVIIPIYGVEKYIERCARSLFEQTLDDIEYIFINDCTKDYSIEILQSIMEEYPHRKKQIQIKDMPYNSGLAAVRKYGISLAKGEYIIHCDSDDWVEKEMYETMYKKAIENNADTVCCGVFIEYDSHTTIANYNEKYNEHQLMYDVIAPINMLYFAMWNRLVSKKIYQRYNIIPFTNINMWEDVGTITRIRFHSSCNIIINKALYHYNRTNILSITHNKQLKNSLEKIKCVQLLEEFFKIQKCEHQYRYFIALLKYKSKEELKRKNTWLWINTFPEAKRYLWFIRHHFNKTETIKLFILSYGAKIIKYFFKNNIVSVQKWRID